MLRTTTLKTVKILLVEDNDFLRMAYQVALSTKFSVETAANGHEALQHMANTQYDAVVSDFQLPDMTGDEALKKATHTPKKGILISGNVADPRFQEAVLQNQFEQLAKPFSKEQLIHILCRITGIT